MCKKQCMNHEKYSQAYQRYLKVNITDPVFRRGFTLTLLSLFFKINTNKTNITFNVNLNNLNFKSKRHNEYGFAI